MTEITPRKHRFKLIGPPVNQGVCLHESILEESKNKSSYSLLIWVIESLMASTRTNQNVFLVGHC